jgi:hypothetical protein
MNRTVFRVAEHQFRFATRVGRDEIGTCLSMRFLISSPPPTASP